MNKRDFKTVPGLSTLLNGNGCCSFLRLKFMPEGGPDGGDGGNGGSIIMQADEGINTLIDYRYARLHKAPNGHKGRGCNCFGKAGDDIILRVPVGTVIYEHDTEELIADLDKIKSCELNVVFFF